MFGPHNKVHYIASLTPFINSEVNHARDLLDGNEKRLMLVVVYVPSCVHSALLLTIMEGASLQLEEFFRFFPDHATATSSITLEPPILAKLDLRNTDDSFTKSLAIDALPILYFFRVVNDELVVMDYMGHPSSEDSSFKVVSMVLHYWYRYMYGPVIALPSMGHLYPFLDYHGSAMLSPVKGGQHPDYTKEERQIIEWLMDTPDDPFSILVQCQSSKTSLQKETYEEITDFCQLQSARRDLACFSIAECNDDGNNVMMVDGDIVSILLHPKNFTPMSSLKKMATQTLHQFGIQRSTPTLLFFERISTAPIAFPLWRSLHAVLFVSLAMDKASKDAILQFYEACLTHRLSTGATTTTTATSTTATTTMDIDDMVCLVVPDTETRVLTSFGIDIWTPLDHRITKGTALPELLPTLMITDKRASNQLKRYYLDAPHIIQENRAILTFLRAFWNNTIQPECKSSNKPLRKNKYGVEMISGKTFKHAVMDRESQHSLLYVFSPTCGHCKRFSILWNKLATLVNHVGWSEFLDIQQLDSTQNEILEVEIDPAFVPAVYYFAPNQKNSPIYYDDADQFGNGAGRLDDPLDIVDWFLDVAKLDEGQLLASLESPS